MEHLTNSSGNGPNRRLLPLVALLVIAFANIIPAQALQSDDGNVYNLIMSRIRTEYQKTINPLAIQQAVTDALPLYNAANGSFTDVNYAATDRTEWPPLEHIYRLYNFTFAYTTPDNIYYQDESIYNKITQGLQYWYDRNPYCSNWWYNQIGEPQRLGIILIQMRTGLKQIPAALEKATLDRMKTDGGNPAAQTGANKLDIALHWLYRAALMQDAALLNTTMSHAFEPIKFVTGEGIQYDYSYFQHGTQFYVIGYGDEVIKGTTQFATYVAGTQFAISTEKIAIFDTFFRQSYLRLIYGQYANFNVLGRGMSRVNATRKKGSSAYCESMISIIPAQSQAYANAIERIKGNQPASYGITPNNTTFFIGDYVMHTRPRLAFGVRTVSKRTRRNEYGNGENLKTYFISDGSTSIATRGDEYETIFPVWDWAMIPGTTTPHFTTIPKASSDWQTPGTSVFTGGASDSLYSVNTYVNSDNYAGINTAAKKSWFFFDNEVVCLGADINSTAAFTVNTTVNQSRLRTDVIIADHDGNVKTLERGDHALASPRWVMQDGVGYIFPQGGNIRLSAKEQSGSWYDINNTQSKDVVKHDVFTLWFDHGMQPTGQSYAYIVAPAKESATDMTGYDASNIEIVANTDSVQVVRNKALDMWQIVFFRKASFTHPDLSLSADKGCAIILKNVSTPSVTMHIADQGQTQSIINVASRIPAISDEYKQTSCDFTNTGVYAGKTKVYVIDKNTPSYQPPVVEKPSAQYTSVAIADAYVRDGATYQNVNYGAEKSLVVKMDGVGYPRDAYLKFSLADMAKINTATDTVKKVIVSLYLTYANTDIACTEWLMYPVADASWGESSITFKNRPANGDTPVARHAGISRDESSTGFNANNMVQFDITVYALTEYAKGNTTLSLTVTNPSRCSSGKHDASFASRETADPQLQPIVSLMAYEKADMIKKMLEFNATDDAYVEQNNPSKNFGSSSEIVVKNMNGGSTDRRGYIKFDITSLNDIEADSVGRIMLRLYAVWGNTDAATPQWIVRSVADQSWKESTLTYANKPAEGALIGTTQAFIPTRSDATLADNFVQFDVTAHVSSLLKSNATSASFYLYQSGSGSKFDMGYASKENAVADRHPKLIAEYYTALGSKLTDTARLRNVYMSHPSPSIKVYPNPVMAGQKLSMDMSEQAFPDPNATVSVYNATGAMVYSQSVNGNRIQITMPSVPGIYIVNVKGSKGFAAQQKVLIN